MDDGTSTPRRNPDFVAAMSGLAVATPPPAVAGTATSSLFGPITESSAGDEEEEDDATIAAATQPVELPDRAPSGICVFSGGTAANSLVDAFQAVATHMGSSSSSRSGSRKTKKPCPLTYIIPISDNGGSSSELIRFFGGPSVGDIRSRLVRLIPTTDEDEDRRDKEDGSNPHQHQQQHQVSERAALRALFEHRLCGTDPRQARAEWLEIVEARHGLWASVPAPTRELVRAHLNTLNLEIVKRARPSSVFNFAGASVGNLFLTGARLYAGSFEAALYLLALLCGIPSHVAVLPAINSNFTHHISAGLANGTVLAGQVNISHPSAPTSLPDGVLPSTNATAAATGTMTTTTTTRARAATAVDFGDATLPGSLPALRRPQIAFSKEDEEDLAAPISRVWYINPYGHEIRPPANPNAVAALQRARAIVYSIGSLYTSIVPSLVLRGVGAAIRRRSDTPKTLILNSRIDRETGPAAQPMTAVDFVRAIAAACQQSQADFGLVVDGDIRLYVTHVVYLQSEEDDDDNNNSRPKVDEAELTRLGIACVSVSAQAAANGTSSNQKTDDQQKKRMDRYDEAALTRVLERIADGTWRESSTN